MASIRGFCETLTKRLREEREHVVERLAEGISLDESKLRELQGRARQLSEAIKIIAETQAEEESK